MTHMDDLRPFLRYASLGVLGMLGLSCYILADTFFVSRALGTTGLAALNLAIPVYSFVNGCGLMLGMGGGIQYSLRRSLGERAEANRVFTAALVLAAGAALLFVSAGLLLSGPLAALLGGRGEVYTLSRTYLQVLLLFSPAFLLNNVLACFVRNDGAPQRAMAAMLGGSLSNILLDWVFLFPFSLGIFGAAFATGLAPLVSMAILSPHLFRGKCGFHVEKAGRAPGPAGVLLSGGVPALAAEVSGGVVMIAFNAILLNLRGNVGVAAYGVVANLSLVVLAVYTGIAQGIQPLVSSCCGSGDMARARRTLGYGVVSALLLSALLYAAIFFGAAPIAGLFNSRGDSLLQSIAVEGLRLYFTACPFAGCNLLLTTYFSAAGLPRPAQAVSLMRGFFLILPLAFLLSRLMGLRGVWCSFPAAELGTAVAGFLLWRRHRKGGRRT